MQFSQRYGYKPAKDAIQVDGIDEALRNGLWSLLEIHVWSHAVASRSVSGYYYLSSTSNSDLLELSVQLWLEHFKQPVDQIGDDWSSVLARLKRYFFGAEWFEVYDFIEFVFQHYSKPGFQSRFIVACNARLEKESSGYRFVGGLITRVTDKIEVDQIDEALAAAKGPIRVHLERALALLSDRVAPDYRNSIKESISAVESLVALTTTSNSGTLGQLLKKLDDQIGLHPALKSAFSSLYGYTSDADGIRHALLEVENIRFEDAKFFLVTCSAFVSFVLAKTDT